MNSHCEKNVKKAVLTYGLKNLKDEQTWGHKND
jgi:hypothetical protein